MKTKLSSLLCDALWLAFIASAFLRQSVLSYVLMSALGVVYLLRATAQSDGKPAEDSSAARRNRALGVLLIVCSVIPLAVMAWRQGA